MNLITKRWPAFVVALLATHVTLMMWAVTKCKSADMRVIPDYYDKAVRYDEFKAQQAAALGVPTTQPNTR